MLISHLLRAESPIDSVLVRGWVKTRRDSKGFSFIELNDGSSIKNLQLILDSQTEGFEALKDMVNGAALECLGSLKESLGKGQRWELAARTVRVLGTVTPEYPLQKKRHSDEFLREIAHLRPRTNKYGALNRLRSELAFAIHSFFRERDFFYVHTPIITGSDAEGAGELFRVTTLPLASASGQGEGSLAKDEPKKSVDSPNSSDPPDNSNPYAEDFFQKMASLTVSGQLEAELLATALGRVYTFGPTFRAERSNTPRHAAEFWMVEPEAAFFDLDDDMDLAEELLKSVTLWIRDKSASDLELFERFVDTELSRRLDSLTLKAYPRIPYSEAIKLLVESKIAFEYPPAYGSDIQTEHERFLSETYFQGPVFVYDYPKSIKPFYMRLTEDESKVRAMDLLVPRVGELIGGSQREEREDKLLSRMEELHLTREHYWWYLDTRRYGSVPHSGFGLGFERLLMLLTGITNIRDVIAFPRTPGSLEF
ncbi:MAG: asparagine--tRNA ligase [Deltaproteobacteria bacterium]|nr:asparagine--tRNA ligase [Deltaproteobacteria bacterium]